MEYVWKDRKRFLGMPLSFTRYAMSDDRLFLSVGCFSIRDEEVLLYRIRDITVTRTLLQRMLGVGTVVVASSDKTTARLELKNIKDPMAVKELLHEHVEEMKLRHRVRVGEIMASNMDNDDDDTDDSDFDDEEE